MKIIKLKDLSEDKRKKIIERESPGDDQIGIKVKEIINDVRAKGDAALIMYGRRFYNPDFNNLKVTEAEFEEARQNVDGEFLGALDQAIKNITRVHEAQLKRTKESIVQPEPGIQVWREWRAIEKVGLYVPGGKATYPSCVLMTVIPAQIAGCKEIIICTPPKSDGKVPAATLVAAERLGVRKIFVCGGAEAVAAMAFGTKTVPSVFKIFGAGGPFVTSAKIVLSSKVAIDMPAGPSEVMIIADETANPKYIAADLLADAEHGEDSKCIVLTISSRVAAETAQEIEKQLSDLPTEARAKASLSRYSFILQVDSLGEAIEFADTYAPEHLEIMTKKPQKIADKVTNAGSIFLGSWTTKSVGDYASGANHVIPTGGWAKTFGPLSVESFGRWIQIQKCSKKGLAHIKQTIEILASAEQLPAHKNSTSIRFK